MRLCTFKSIVTAVFLWGYMASAVASTGGADNETLVLAQQHCWYNKLIVYLNKNSMLVQIPSRKIELYAKAPEWTVICRNSSRHQYSSTSYKDWIVHGPGVSGRQAGTMPHWK